VLRGRQRGPPRRAGADHPLPAPHAEVQGRRRDLSRTVAARAFPIVRDLVSDRGALDKLIQAAGYVSCHTGGVPDANAIPISKPDSDYSMDAAECIGCGACVAACPNGAAMLFAERRCPSSRPFPRDRSRRRSGSPR